MTYAELIRELRACERRIADLNDAFRWKGGERPSVADPVVCARRGELRTILRERTYDDADTVGFTSHTEARLRYYTPEEIT